jgi:hypothetical protein
MRALGESATVRRVDVVRRSRTRPRAGLVASFLLIAIGASHSVAAQTTTAGLVGTVTDSSGAVLPGATVRITNADTNATSVVHTTDTGAFVAPGLPPGTYTLVAEMDGFKQQALEDVRLLANRTTRVEVVLSPGAVTEVVDVRAGPPVVNSESATIGNTLESRTITALPLNGRTIDRLIRISAGVTSDSASNPRIAGSAYWGGIQFNVDGVGYNDTGNGGAAYSFRNGAATLPSIDTVAEFKIDSNSQKAEFEGSASVTVVTKSGTNDVHGSAYLFNRTKALAAKNFFATALPRPPFERNEFGVTAGGPVRRDRTFFFGSYEGLRERFPRVNTLSVATAAMRAGDFSGLPTIVDPLTGVPFPGNRLPAGRIDPRARALLDFVPLPTRDGVGPAGTLNNYQATIENVSDINRFGARLDQRLGARDTLWGSFNYSKGSPYFIAQNFPEGYGSWSDGGYKTRNVNITHTRTFSPRAVNEARYGWFGHTSVRFGMNTDFDPRSIFPGLYGPLDVGGLPNVNISSHVAVGDYGGFRGGGQFTHQFIDNFTYVAGHHTLKAGVDIAHSTADSPPQTFGMLSGLAQNAGLGRFDFDGRYTSSGAAAQPAHAFADFLLGYPTFAYRSTPSPGLVFRQMRYSAYAQDDWQLSPRLTLNLGVRYMVQKPWDERDGNLANFDFASGRLVIPGGGLPPQAQARLVEAYPIVTSTAAGVTGAIETDWNNLGPRVGVAFRPFANGKTVLRGGVGLFYNTLPLYIGFRQLGFSNPPFLLAETFEASAGRVPSLTLADPFPGQGVLSPNPAVNAVQTDIQNGRSLQWNVTLEREIVRQFGARISYVGNRTTFLPWFNNSVNVPREQAPGAIQPRRPYQPWSNILVLSSDGRSELHQLQLEATKRYSGGLAFQVEYSWTRSLDNAPIVGGPENPYDPDADWGNSDQVRRHVFTLAYTYGLPFGPGRRFGGSLSGLLGTIVGGWELGGITYVRSGIPFSVTFLSTTPGWSSGRADLVGDPTLPRGERSIDGWFDPSAFAVPAPFTYGNSPRNVLFGPGDIVIDMSLMKNTAINDDVTVQFRAEFFNLLNHTNFGNPAANISVASTVGRIFGAGDPRQVQFGLKVLW